MQFSLRWKNSGAFTHTGTDCIPGWLLQMAHYSGSRFSLWESLSFLGIPGATVPLDLHFWKTQERRKKPSLPKRAHCPEQSVLCSFLVQADICNQSHNEVFWTRHQYQSMLKPQSMLLGYYKTIAPVIPVCGGSKLPLWFWIWRTTAETFPPEASFLQVAVSIFYSFNHLQNIR